MPHGSGSIRVVTVWGVGGLEAKCHLTKDCLGGNNSSGGEQWQDGGACEALAPWVDALSHVGTATP